MMKTITALIAVATMITGVCCQAPLDITGLEEQIPVAIRASATDYALVVDLTFEKDWHAYSRDVGGGQPVQIVLDRECGFESTGFLEAPGDEKGLLSNKVRLTLPMKPKGKGRDLRARLELQVCDALQCLAPMSLTLSGVVKRNTILLVFAKKDERADRIVTWLTKRHFDVVTELYTSVTHQACDSRDLVICDSELFQKHGVSVAVAREFPRTKAPMIAVGFLGTQIAAAHGLAMTSGYI
jgi:hypothetical protein